VRGVLSVGERELRAQPVKNGIDPELDRFAEAELFEVPCHGADGGHSTGRPMGCRRSLGPAFLAAVQYDEADSPTPAP
jgi:hypothetical protein